MKTELIWKTYLASFILILAFSATGCVGGDPLETEMTPGLRVENSPLDQYTRLAWITQGTPEEQMRQTEAREQEIDSLVAQCMHNLGFEFSPRLRDETGNSAITFPENLSESELEAWWSAYWGPQGEMNDEGEFAWSFENAGCSGQAEYIVNRETYLAASEEFRPLFDAILQLDVNISISPALVALNADWASCMADAGYYDMTKPEAIQTLENAATDFDLSDLNCQEELEYVSRITRIIYDAETQFVQDNRESLEALRSAAEQRN